MSGSVTYIMTLAAELAAALPWKADDPLTWGAFVFGILLFGALLLPSRASMRRGGAVAVASARLLLVGLVIVQAAYLAMDARETVAVLPAKVYDPIAWATLLGALVVGVGIGWSSSHAWRLVWAFLAIALLLLLLLYYVSKLPSGDRWALILMWYVGLLVGLWLPRLNQREANSS
jgi:hypothetical protein